MNVNWLLPNGTLTLVTTGESVSTRERMYGGEPPDIVIPHGAQVSMFPVTLAVTVNAGVFNGVVTHSVVCPAKVTQKHRNRDQFMK